MFLGSFNYSIKFIPAIFIFTFIVYKVALFILKVQFFVLKFLEILLAMVFLYDNTSLYWFLEKLYHKQFLAFHGIFQKLCWYPDATRIRLSTV